MSLASWWREIVLKHSPTTIEFVGTSIVQAGCFWLASAVYTSLPYIFPAFSERHKLQKQEKQPTAAELKDCLGIVTRNQIISSTLHIGLLNLDRLLKKPPAYRFDATLPSVGEIACGVAFGLLAREVLFYYVHRAFHHPSIYPYVHKPHHRFTAPVALAAQYATVTEHLFANILPISLPLMLIRAHIVTFWTFLGLELLETTTVHSGYDFFKKAAAKHDKHHESFMVNFGTMGLLDWIHGTNKLAKKKTG